MSGLDEQLALENAARRALGLERVLPTADVGEERVDFTSSDALGLANDPALLAGAVAFGGRFGTGAKAARLLGGAARASRLAEQAAVAWLGDASLDALLFPSGYQANVAALSTLAGRGDVLFSDRLAHASLIDGMRLSRARVRVHAHLDLDELAHQLRAARGARRRLVVTESVFSMDGDGADLATLAELCRAHDAWLYVDEAHAGGIVGPAGRGACAAFAAALEGVSLVRLFTGGKAFGAAGALVVGSPELVRHLAQSARGAVFTTGVSPLVAGALVAAVERVAGADERRAALHARTAQLAAALGVSTGRGAIVPYAMGDTGRVLELSAGLAERGFDVRGIRPPTVPAGTSRLRFVAHAEHTSADVTGVVAALRELEAKATPSAPIELRSAAPSPLFVVGTDTDVGKTVAAAMLMQVARRLGPARYFKPVQTGSDSDTRTVARLAGLPEAELLEPVYQFALPASPHEAARAEGARVEREVLYAGLDAARSAVGDARLVVELAGGLLVPFDDEGFDQAELLAREARELVLVARAGLGTLNHTQLTLEALAHRGLRPRALILVGPPHASNRATLARLVEHVVELPHLPELSPAALAAWVDERFELDRLADLLP